MSKEGFPTEEERLSESDLAEVEGRRLPGELTPEEQQGLKDLLANLRK